MVFGMNNKDASAKDAIAPGLYIVSTPIGNMGDITLRALETLRSAAIVACEDTRVSAKLFSRYGLRARTISLHGFNEEKRMGFIRGEIEKGAAVALISDAGTPLISDPGYRIASGLRAAGLYVTAVPGASSLVDALVLSGMPTDRFMFVGFAPAAQVGKRKFFEGLAGADATVVFFETANRLLSTLSVLDSIMPGRQIAVARELTKIHEEVRTGNPAVLIDFYKNRPPKGECVVLVRSAESKPGFDRAAALRLLAGLLPHMGLKAACGFLSGELGFSRNDVYKLGLEMKGGAGDADNGD
jgi:16S rRNA (cytidine1402-2'-O)-methyltransferase